MLFLFSGPAGDNVYRLKQYNQFQHPGPIAGLHIFLQNNLPPGLGAHCSLSMAPTLDSFVDKRLFSEKTY
ncbi:hypothetical protein D3C86_2017190 [compost metagenome]